MSNLAKELRERLELLPFMELKQQASKNYGVKVQKDYTKEDLINLIVGSFSKHDFAHATSGDMPEAGWSRIKVANIPGRNNFPFYQQINGYTCFVPFNTAVDVPTKVLGVLDDATEMRYTDDGNNGQTMTAEQSYVYSLIATTPGPDPRPGLEVGRERKLAAKRAFAEKEGYWPRDSDIRASKNMDSMREMFGTNS